MNAESANTNLWTHSEGRGTEPGEARASEGQSPGDLRRVEIVVRDPGNCPVLVEGGRMVYAHPEVLKDESDRICAQALSTLAPAAEEVARWASAGRSDTFWERPLEVACQAPECSAVFMIRPLGPGRAAPAARGTGSLPSSVTRRLLRFGPAEDGTGPFMSRLAPEVINEIVDMSEVAGYDAPTVVIREGQEGEALYIVAEGEVEVLHRGADGHEVVLAAPGAGECLGEMSLLTGQPASATVRTRGDRTTMLVLPREKLEGLLRRRPELHKEFSRIIAERLYQSNAALQAEASHAIAGRLSMIGIVDLVQTLHAARRTGTLILEDGKGGAARVGFTQGAVSAAVGGDRAGVEAFYELLGWGDGDFSFEGGEPALGSVEGAAIQGETMGLLMEGLRRLDERNK